MTTLTHVSDELDAATVERCAQVAENPRLWPKVTEAPECERIASAIRSLIPNSAGDARTTHLQGEGEPVVKQVADEMHVDRVEFRISPARFTDVPSTFAITKDGREWRLSEREIVNALNARSLIPKSANEIHSSDGGVEGHAAVPLEIPAQRSGESRDPLGDGSVKVGPHREDAAGIKPGPSEAICTCPVDWQGMDHTSGCKSRASRILVRKLVDDPNSASGKSLQYVEVTQDCAPAGTVSEEELTERLAAKISLPTSDCARVARALLSQFDVRRK